MPNHSKAILYLWSTLITFLSFFVQIRYYRNFNSNCERLVDIKNNYGKTALHYCVHLPPNEFSIELTHLMIKAGASIDLIDLKGRTPFFYLISQYKFFRSYGKDVPSPFIEILLKANCDPLNYYSLHGQVLSLKHLCRLFFQTYFRDTHFDRFVNILPKEVINFLNRQVANWFCIHF